MPATPQVDVEQGRLEGFEDDGIIKFFGVPYAMPPLAQLRWQAPRAPSGWVGIRRANVFAPICPQVVGATSPMRQDVESEDCLYLNVWTRTCDPAAEQPVIFWIHGGGNLGGSGSEENCDGSHLAAKGVTVITFNYRLGAFGFLAHPLLGANFGLLDQLEALKWVNKNTRAFGGNPKKVTIAGESAGATAVRTLMSCPLARGLFHRIVLQSAGFEKPACVESWSIEKSRRAAEALFGMLGSRDPQVLRQTNMSAVKDASHALSGVPPKPGQIRTPADLVWMPVVDGTTVQENLQSWPVDVPLLMGCVENEARYFLKPHAVYPADALQKLANKLCGAQADAVIAQYAKLGLTQYEQLDRIMTTAIFTEPAMESLRRFTRSGHCVYHYHFARKPPGAIATNELVKHTSDIRYVFGTLNRDDFYDKVDLGISQIMQDAWISFSELGSPETPGMGKWPQYTASTPMTTWLEDTADVRPYPETKTMSLINSLRTANRPYEKPSSESGSGFQI